MTTVLGLVACGGPEAGQDPIVPAVPSALMDKADGMDTADNACQVVLRDARTGVYYAGHYNLEGSVDVARDLLITGQVEVDVLYRHKYSGSGWATVRENRGTVEPVAGAEPHMQRFAFNGVTVPDAIDSSKGARIELIPFVKFPNGKRLFDHNRNQDVFANYVFYWHAPLQPDAAYEQCTAGPHPTVRLLHSRVIATCSSCLNPYGVVEVTGGTDPDGQVQVVRFNDAYDIVAHASAKYQTDTPDGSQIWTYIGDSALNQDRFGIRYVTGNRSYWDDNQGAFYRMNVAHHAGLQGSSHLGPDRAIAVTRAGGDSGLTGELLVRKGLTSSEDVSVVYGSSGEWSSKKATLIPMPTEIESAVDRYQFEIPVTSCTISEMDFAAVVKADDGHEYWDNNYTQDFHCTLANATWTCQGLTLFPQDLSY